MIPLQLIIEDAALAINRYEPVYGGDINHAYCLYDSVKKYFLKVNDTSQYPAMLEKEAKGLHSLRKFFNGRIPEVIRWGVVNQYQYLLLEWIENGNNNDNSWNRFGNALATMHQQAQPYFGWEEENYIGSLVQQNTKHDAWHSFYSECRIRPLVKSLFDKGSFSKQDIIDTELFFNKTENFFPYETPALLHGDLWAGNFMITTNGEAAIYDPAVYYGHREMDIGMTKLFGGFDQQFYTAYNQIYPLEKNWLQRLPLTQLYPILVHAVLFGGHYVANAREIIRRFSR